jgi:hypothetical protein
MTNDNGRTMDTTRKRRRLWVTVALAAICALVVPAAVAISSDDAGSGLSGDVGDAKVAYHRAQAAADPAPLPDPHPLTGRGENMEIVANVPIDFGADIELHGDYAYVSTYGTCGGGPTPTPGTPPPGNCTAGTGGVSVIDISDPENPERVGLFDCAGGQNDVQLSPDGKWLAMAIETINNACHPGEEGSVVISLEDPENPVEVAFLPVFDRAGNYEGSHNHTIDWPYLYIDQYTDEYNKIDIFDLTDPDNPERLDPILYGPPDDASFTTTSPHDLIVEHREDGKDYLYASSGNQTSDVIDVTDPRNPVILQRLVDPAVDFAHQSELNHDSTLNLITDEYRGGGEARACGKTPTQDGPRDIPNDNGRGDRNNLGALYFYKTDPVSGLLARGPDGQPVVEGTYNLPLQTGGIDPALGQGCTVHIYWQAPDENRLVVSWYGRGSRVVDYSNPRRAKELGWFIPDGADTWSAKPHNGYIFTGDIARGFDVLRYTGENGERWPSTAGPAEVQRAEQQGQTPPAGAGRTESALSSPAVTGEPTVNTNPGPKRLASGNSRAGFARELAKARRLGGAMLTRKLDLGTTARRNGKVTLTIRTDKGSIVSRVKAAVKAGQRSVKVRAQITGVRGKYRWSAAYAGRNVGKGRFKVAGKPAASAQLKANETLVCRIIS